MTSPHSSSTLAPSSTVLTASLHSSCRSSFIRWGVCSVGIPFCPPQDLTAVDDDAGSNYQPTSASRFRDAHRWEIQLILNDYIGEYESHRQRRSRSEKANQESNKLPKSPGTSQPLLGSHPQSTDMSQADFDFMGSESPLSSPLPSPLQPQPLSQTATPTQGDYDKDRLPQSQAPQRQVHMPPQASPLKDVEAEWEREQQREMQREMEVDKFAVLFAPSTPRASPVLAPTSLAPIPDDSAQSSRASPPVLSLFSHPAQSTSQSRPPPRPSHSRSRPSSIISTASSDFGSFIEVAASEDPLSVGFGDDSALQIPGVPSTSGDITPSALGSHTPSRPPSSSSTKAPFPSLVHISSTSKHGASSDPLSTSANHHFFETFTQDAKQRSSAARSKVLDELLLHEDDPMWFIADQRPNQPLSEDVHSEETRPPPLDADIKDLPITPALSSPPPPPPPPKSPKDARNRHRNVVADADSLRDLDHDYFRPSPTPTPANQTPQASHPRYASAPGLVSREPSRSGSIPAPAPPTLAPPLASQLTASPPSPTQRKHTLSNSDNSYWAAFDPLTGDGGDESDDVQSSSDGRPSLAPLGRSSSYQTISSLSSKWVSSLLRGGPTSPPPPAASGGARPALESIYSQSPPKQRPDVGQRRNSSLPPAGASDLHEEQRVPPHHSQTLPASSGASTSHPHPYQQPTFSHSTPFAPASVTHGASAFAPAVYVPPAGAPGFMGDHTYDWDKGFSDELEDERMRRSGPRSVPVSTSGRRNGDELRRDRSAIESSLSASGSRGGGGGGWGSGFGFGFGSVRASKGKSLTPSPSSLGGLGSGVGSGREQPKSAGEYADWRRPERENIPPGGNTNDRGMGEFIEKKTGNVELVGRKASSMPVLTPELAAKLRAYLPALSRLPKSWTLIYSLDQHGISLNTLYTRCEAHLTRKPAPGEVMGLAKGMLVVVKDAAEEGEHEAVFGAWVAEGVVLNKGKGYSGGGESFLWKYVDDSLKVFKTTGRNNYVALCEPEYLSFGGGDGHYGLYLDDTLFDGSSAACPTFDNEPLCSLPGGKGGTLKTVKFECVGLEVWGLGA